MLELITDSIHFDNHEKPAYLTYRMPAYSGHNRAHIPIALSHEDDVEMIYETLQNNPDIEYAEIYVDTITSESWDDIAGRVNEIGRTHGEPSTQNEGSSNVDSDSSPPPSDRNDSSDDSEEVSDDDSDGDAEVPEREHMPPTAHYTMINTPVYATSEMPEIP
ncbi:hypothetical protein LINPERHAP1_LOCUS2786, partial [Linum perenne]